MTLSTSEWSPFVMPSSLGLGFQHELGVEDDTNISIW